MNQKRNSPPANDFSIPHHLLAKGLSCLSGIGLLSAGAAFAQATPELYVPSAQDLLQSDVNFTPAPDPIESASPEPWIPPAIAAPEVELVVPAPAAPEPVLTETPLPSNGRTPADLVSPNLSEDASAAFGTGTYIDSTPYDLGATQTNQPDIVLSERSTGCQSVLKPGDTAPSSICPPANLPAGVVGQGGGYNPAGGYSVYNLGSNPTTSARSFYNLTVRPPARLSNGNVNLLFPLSIPAVISSAFGWRVHPIAGEMRFHSGTDIAAPQGTPVLAAFDGKVEIADFVGGYGLTIVLQHNKGTEQTLYAHLSELFVKPGETVKQGEAIGRVGSTGLSTGPHLHFEFRKLTQEGWVVMDPGTALEQALVQMLQGPQLAQRSTELPAVFQYPGKSLRMVIDKEQAPSAADSATEPETEPKARS
ncbi:M23 family metallopeptidase [Egbenema bharatensis]|uniref:M23 family metallopeptidase n=1 Tax=Egbenema bharatensis TaxID=3463334 RepID=UPI003A85990E